MLNELRACRRRMSLFLTRQPRRVHTAEQLRALINAHRDSWGLPQRISVEAVVEYLLATTRLRVHVIRLPHAQNVERYTWGAASPLEMAVSVSASAYLCHATALWLHGLTSQQGNCVYVNHEQSPKPSDPDSLTQSSIDAAFSKPQRESGQRFTFNGVEVVVIRGKFTNRLQVRPNKGPAGEVVDVTGVERTLIDAAVRPSYAGGIDAVLRAYRLARGRVSPKRLAHTLDSLGYVYPYQQAVGFLLERAGFEPDSLAHLRTTDVRFDFYLCHAMSRTGFDDAWRIHYPLSLDDVAPA